MSYHDRWIDVIGLLVRKPRSTLELIELCHPVKSDTIYRYLNLLRGEGLIEHVDGRGVRGDPMVFRWVNRDEC